MAVVLGTAMLGCSTKDMPPGPSAASVPPPSGGGVVGVNPAIASQPGARSTTVTYGPWKVPAGTATEEGTLKNQLDLIGVQKPCQNCYIVGIEPTLKYTDGRVANVDTGQMLHHVVLIQQGRKDSTCGLVQGIGALGERFYASGNERTQLHAPAGSGYDVGPLPWTLVYDLMNHTTVPTNVQIEITFKWVPKNTAGMKAQRPVWLDIANCTFGDVKARTGAYSYSYDWTVDVPGKLYGIGGHLHDSGAYINITDTTTGQLICNSVAGYGGPGYEVDMDHDHAPGEHDQPGEHSGPPTTDGHGHTDADHARMRLSSMSQCVAPTTSAPVATLVRGHKIRLTAYYNDTSHPPHGTHPVMGIAIAYIEPA
jgi:hypothetical protein